MNGGFKFKSLLLAGTLSLISPLPGKCQPFQAQYPIYEDVDGYAVLSLLLGRHYDHTSPALQVYALTIGDKGAISLSDKACRNRIPKELESARTDFEQKNRVRMRLVNHFSVAPAYKLLEKPEVLVLPPIAPGDQELRIEDRRPFYAVSAVGFYQSRTRAIARVDVYCGPECYSGGYYLLKKNSKGWILLEGSPVCEAIA